MDQERDMEMIVEQPEEGSTILKFRSGEERDAAYAALEKEFTKKSQRVKELERENMSMREAIPQQEDSDVEEFLSQFPNAREMGEEIAEMLEEHPEWEGKESLLRAYAGVMAQRYRTPEQMLEDEEFISELAANPLIRERIINEYLSDTPESVRLPLGGGIPAAPKGSPKNIEEAGRLLEEILKTK